MSDQLEPHETPEMVGEEVSSDQVSGSVLCSLVSLCGGESVPCYCYVETVAAPLSQPGLSF